MKLCGLAVTKPYKDTILQYLDGMDETARQMGACNTVVVRDGAWIGYNTDGMGLSLIHIYSHISTRKIDRLGAGREVNFYIQPFCLPLCFLDCISGFQNLRRSTAKRIYAAVLFFLARWEVVSVQVVAEDRDMPPALYVDLLSYIPF